MELSDLCKELKAEYVSVVSDGKTLTYKSGMSINSNVDVPKGKSCFYKVKGGQWKSGKV